MRGFQPHPTKIIKDTTMATRASYGGVIEVPQDVGFALGEISQYMIASRALEIALSRSQHWPYFSITF